MSLTSRNMEKYYNLTFNGQNCKISEYLIIIKKQSFSLKVWMKYDIFVYVYVHIPRQVSRQVSRDSLSVLIKENSAELFGLLAVFCLLMCYVKPPYLCWIRAAVTSCSRRTVKTVTDGRQGPYCSSTPINVFSSLTDTWHPSKATAKRPKKISSIL